MNQIKIDFLLNEYTQICNNLRHINELRAKVVQFTISLYGLLLITLATILKKSNLILSEIDKDIINYISIFGVFISFIAFFLENRLIKHFKVLKKRAFEIEEFFLVKGQFIKSESINGISFISLLIGYGIVNIFWLIILLSY